jgi:hypothetical protein
VKFSSGTIYNLVKAFLKWIPFLIFFSVITYLLVTEFKNDVDEYFVRIVLKACLMVIVSCALSQAAAFVILNIWNWLFFSPRLSVFKEFFDFVCAFPIVDIGIFSIGIFFTGPTFFNWVWILALLMVLDTLQYWIGFAKSPLRNLYAFARFHQIDFYRTHAVLGPYFFSAFLNYFFISLKKTLLPLVFILVVMDFRIILPRLVEAGLTYQAFALLMSLMISLHLLSHKEDFA